MGQPTVPGLLWPLGGSVGLAGGCGEVYRGAMAIKLVVLDFDGTFTDAEAEAAGFVEAFKADVFDLLGRDATLAWQREEDVLRANPSDYGWSNDGVIAAPATADPYLRVTVLAQNLCDIFGILRNPATRTEVLEAL